MEDSFVALFCASFLVGIYSCLTIINIFIMVVSSLSVTLICSLVAAF